MGGPGPALTRILTHVHTHARTRTHAREAVRGHRAKRAGSCGERLGGRREARPAPCPRLPPDRLPPRPWNRFLSFKGGGGPLCNFCCWGGGGLCIDCPTKPVRSA